MQPQKRALNTASIPRSQQLEGETTKQLQAPARLARWDASGVTVPRYFLLVVLSLTGLSTLLGLTETVDACELTTPFAPQDPALTQPTPPWVSSPPCFGARER